MIVTRKAIPAAPCCADSGDARLPLLDSMVPALTPLPDGGHAGLRAWASSTCRWAP